MQKSDIEKAMKEVLRELGLVIASGEIGNEEKCTEPKNETKIEETKDGEVYAKLASEKGELAEKCFNEDDLVFVNKMVVKLRKLISDFYEEDSESIFEDGPEEGQRILRTVGLCEVVLDVVEKTARAQRKDGAGLYIELVGFLTGLFLLESGEFTKKAGMIRTFIRENL